MRRTIGGTWVFQLVIIFVLMFAAYLALSINMSKTYKMKNEMLNFIEKNQGVTDGENGSIYLINNYLRYNNYRATGKCEEGYYGALSIDDDTNSNFEFVNESNTSKYYYCIKKVTNYNKSYPQRSYYRVKLFLEFNLPVVGNIINFNVEGKTTEISHTFDSDLFTVNY